MKNPKTMTYREMEKEVTANHCKMAKMTPEQKRELILRNHDLMVEMDARWGKPGFLQKK